MNIAFAIINLFPGGGLQRECIALASRLRSRGHKITIFAQRCWGPLPEELNIEILPSTKRTNHGRQLAMADAVVERCNGRFDRIVGFNKLKNLDVLYCADPCIARRKRSFLSYLAGRQQTLVALEGESFAPGHRTKCILLSEPQLQDFAKTWSTEPARLKLLPPSLETGRRRPDFRTDGTGEKLRKQLGLGADDFVWLAIAGQPAVKGLDRTVAAMKEFPEARLLVAGIASDSKQARLIERWTKNGNQNISLLGYRGDIPQLMAASDLFVHPARYDTTGVSILESVVNGLPVITTANCGYATHVTAGHAGTVIPDPFDDNIFIAALRASRARAQRDIWSKNAVDYGTHADLYSGLDRASEIIES